MENTTTITYVTVGSLKANGHLEMKKLSNYHQALEIINYIDFIAMNNSEDSSGMSVPIVENTFVYNRKDVNKEFFEYIKNKQPPVADSVTINSSQEENIKNIFKGRDEERKRQLNASIELSRSEFTSLQRRANEQLSIIARSYSELNGHAFVSDKIVDNLKNGLKDTSWNFLSMNGSIISFVSRSEIILRHQNKKAGVDITVNCGKFKVDWNTSSNTLKVLPYSNNVVRGISNYIHPHVGANGDVCWGNAANSYRDAMSVYDIVKALTILGNLLKTYNDESPYVSMNDFEKFVNKRQEMEREMTNGSAKKDKEWDDEEYEEPSDGFSFELPDPEEESEEDYGLEEQYNNADDDDEGEDDE